MKLVVPRRPGRTALVLPALVLAAALATAAPATAALVGPGALADTSPSATVGPSGSLGPTATTPPKPNPTPNERAAAIVGPATRYLEVHWDAWVRGRVGDTRVEENVLHTTRCSGFGVSNDGFLVTVGHCVDPAAVKTDIVTAAARQRVTSGALDADDETSFRQTLLSKGIVEGREVGDPVGREVFVQRGIAQVGQTTGESLAAQVVSIRTPAEGDLALLKIERLNQPIVEVTDPDQLERGLDILTAGYSLPGGSTTPGMAVKPAFREGQVLQTQIEGTATYNVITTMVSPGLAGGPVVDLDGKVVGMVSPGPTVRAPGSSYLLLSSLIADELEANDVNNSFGDIDNEYRGGLAAYFDGRYGDAIQHLDAVLAIMPTHSQAQEYRQQAVARREVEREVAAVQPQPDRTLLWVGVAAAALLGLVGLGAGALHVLRRRAAGLDSAPARARRPAPELWYCANCSVGSEPGTEICPTCRHAFRV